MAAEQRKLLEQLMGASASSRAQQLSLNDPKVCRSYIAGTCPHDLFTNTKQDLGPCPKVHAEALKTEYEGLSEREKHKYGFEYDYMRDLQKYIDECNRRIDAAQRRLEKTPDEIRQTNALVSPFSLSSLLNWDIPICTCIQTVKDALQLTIFSSQLKTISDLTSSINSGLLEVEILGSLGEVSRAQDELFRVRQAAQQKAEREKELKALSDTSGPSGHQKLQVCDVCGAYLSRLDNDRRLADHFYGKMHLGYAQMRKTYDAFPKEMKGRSRPAMDDDGPGGGGPRGPRGPGGYRSGRGGRGYRGGW